MPFDPKKYLQKKGGFDPNTYLQGKGAPPDATLPLPPDSRGGSDSYTAQLVSNIPESAGQFVGNIASAVAHPVTTAENIGKLLWAGLKLGPGAMGGTMEDRATMQPVIEDLVGRYGGWENIANTLKTDPVGFVGDLSMLVGGTGGAMKAVGGGGKIGEIGQAVSKAGAVIDPIGGPIGAMKKVLPLETTSRKLYRSAIKPSTALSPAEREAVVTTGITERVVPSETGYLKLQEKISDLNRQVLEETSRAAKAGTTIDTKAVVQRIEDVENYFKNDIDPKPHLRDLQNLKQRFLAAHGKTLTAEEAQKIKQASGSILRKTYGEMKPALIEGKKALVRGLKEELAKEVPEIAGLNARESALLRLEPHIEKAIGRIENLNLMSLSAPMTGAVFAASAESPSLGIKTMIIREILDNPQFKSRLSFVLDQAKRRGFQRSTITPAATTGRVLAPEE